MAFAKKFTRRITVGTETYLWYLRDNSLDFEVRRVAIRHAEAAGQLLLIEPGPMEIRPRSIRAAILFALGHGWRPTEAGSAICLAYQQDDFVALSA